MSSIEAAVFGHHEADPRALLYYEWCQRGESGYAVADFAEDVNELSLADRPMDADCWRLLDRIESATRLPGWPHFEWIDTGGDPNIIGVERDSPAARTPSDYSRAELYDRVHGGWLGRCAGCVVARPRDSGVIGCPRDENLDYILLGLHLLEQSGTDFIADDVSALWLERLPFLRTSTAERVAYRNLIDGFLPPDTATYRNPYREWRGALVRADIYGYTNPGDPARAAELAARDASISHTGNGLWAARWAAALVAAAFTAANPQEALARAETVIPANSRLAVALSELVDDHTHGLAWQYAVTGIHTRYAHYNRLHVIGNACLIAAGLLWGEGDFTETVQLTARAGWDVNSNAATAGSIAGIFTGAANIPARWTDPLENTLHSAVTGYPITRISDLATRTHRLLT
ncbi:ADP-ribosylglycohydrolase family protein [Nocardia sp. SYP-A9097]|uniref:ADP-ribosylglycohydrolase family protein n=1 Tax=Nocardia sp. SYP-A9097 TaxID=2663237 RepID=UPI002815C85D|nr:ADP-ribosylglycohydrolase family protein [Nocardia sp. SYP-A9097]